MPHLSMGTGWIVQDVRLLFGQHRHLTSRIGKKALYHEPVVFRSRNSGYRPHPEVSLIPLTLLIMPIGTASAGALPADVSRHVLDNGLTIYLAPMDTPGVASYQSWVEVGSKDEVEEGTTGFAHFFEHLMFYGSEDLPRVLREERMLLTGAAENAWTWVDDTCYHQVVASEALLDVIVIEADRFQKLHVTEEQVAKESGAVLGEYRKGLSSPWERTYDALYETAFDTHTYRHSTIGYEADILAMPTQVELVKSFFSTHYRPDNTRIVVAGDFDTETVLASLEANYGEWQPSAVPAPEIPEEAPQEEARRVEVAWDQGPVNAHLMMGWKVPGWSATSEDAAALDLVSELLYSDVASLHRQLVVDEARVYDLSGGDWGHEHTHLFMAIAEVKDPADLAAVEADIEAAIQALASVDEATVAAARENALRRGVIDLDNPKAVANQVGQMTRGGADPADIDTWFDTYAALGVEDVKRVVETYFVPEGRTVAVLDPSAETAAVEEPEDSE